MRGSAMRGSARSGSKLLGGTAGYCFSGTAYLLASGRTCTASTVMSSTHISLPENGASLKYLTLVIAEVARVALLLHSCTMRM